MSRINLTPGFMLIPEGNYVFYIYDCTYDEAFGRMVIKMTTADGLRYDERFNLKDDNDQPNERALNAFSFFAKTAMNNFGLEEIDHTDLIGHYIRMDIEHNKVISKKDGKTLTFANSGAKAVATEFDNQPVASVVALMNQPRKAAPAPATAPTVPAMPDLDALLG